MAATDLSRPRELVEGKGSMATREPFRYELTPRAIDEGEAWLRVTLENRSDDTLRELDVRLNSLDAYGIEVLSQDQFVPVLGPGAKEVITIQVLGKLSSSLYVSADGQRDGERFHWESPDLTVTVGDEAAELVSLLALSEPKAAAGEVVRCEATLRGRLHSEGLRLAFWAETPSGGFQELAIVETKALSPDEEARYVAAVEVEEEGRYTIYAYLYDGITRIGRQVETIQVGSR